MKKEYIKPIVNLYAVSTDQFAELAALSSTDHKPSVDDGDNQFSKGTSTIWSWYEDGEE